MPPFELGGDGSGGGGGGGGGGGELHTPPRAGSPPPPPPLQLAHHVAAEALPPLSDDLSNLVGNAALDGEVVLVSAKWLLA